MKQLNWYQIFGKSNIPDGRTVLPTDDIQIWLHCANIWDKAYTTLAEVLADTDTLLALITSNNAVDYMVRSTTWAVAQALVPIMTDNTHPSGVASASQYMTGREPYRAFNGTDNIWQANSATTNQWLQYEFDSPVCLKEAHVIVPLGGSPAYACAKRYTIYGSTDGINFDTLASGIFPNSYAEVTIALSNETTPYKFVRLLVIDSYTVVIRIEQLQLYSASVTTSADAMTAIGQNNYCANTLLADATWCNAICNSEYFESVLNVKVPTMTGYTTPEGVVSAKSESGSYLAWKAFDRNNSTYWQTADNALPQWIQYKFVSSVKAYLVSAWWGVRYPTQLKIQGSNDGSTWTDITETLSGTGTTRTDKYVISSPSDYLYYRLNIIQVNVSPYNVYSNAIQFYGREDV